MADSSDIDQALVDKLAADEALMALMPDGVFLDEAGRSFVTGSSNCTRFVIVSLVDEHDTPVFEGRSSEDNLYAVKAVELKPAIGSGNVKAAAARIDALLDPQGSGGSLTIAGYGLLVMRRRERIRMLDVDSKDETIRWNHRGGRYQVMVAVLADYTLAQGGLFQDGLVQEGFG
jgi:hypothetical protein